MNAKVLSLDANSFDAAVRRARVAKRKLHVESDISNTLLCHLALWDAAHGYQISLKAFDSAWPFKSDIEDLFCRYCFFRALARITKGK